MNWNENENRSFSRKTFEEHQMNKNSTATSQEEEVACHWNQMKKRYFEIRACICNRLTVITIMDHSKYKT